MSKSLWVRFLSLIASWAVIIAAILVMGLFLFLVARAKVITVNKPLSATASTEQNFPTASSTVVSTSTVVSKTEYVSVNEIIPKLIDCESGGVDLIHLDTDGYYSYDVTQFHLLTFLNFGKQFGVLPATTTEAEARVLIMQPNLDIQLTSLMLKAGLWKQWYNCNKALGINSNTIIY